MYGVGVSYLLEDGFTPFESLDFNLAALLSLAKEGCEINLDNLDFNRADLLGWIRCTLAALSRAEKASVKSLAALLTLTFLTKDFKVISRFLLRAVLTLSFRTFLMAD